MLGYSRNISGSCVRNKWQWLLLLKEAGSVGTKRENFFTLQSITLYLSRLSSFKLITCVNMPTQNFFEK